MSDRDDQAQTYREELEQRVKDIITSRSRGYDNGSIALNLGIPVGQVEFIVKQLKRTCGVKLAKREPKVRELLTEVIQKKKHVFRDFASKAK